MKRYVLSMMLAAMFLPTGLLGQEPEQEEMEFQMQMRRREMEMREREAQMQEIELEKRRIELDRLHQKDKLHPLLLLVIVVHILSAVWVYQDIRRRGRGSGIWIVIAVLTGLLGTLVYAVVRLGDSEEKKA